MPELHTGRFDEAECLRLSDIATWIPTLVFQGLVDEVIWVSGAWCGQFRVGTEELLVGRYKKDGTMKIAVKIDVWTDFVDYWVGDGSLVRCADLDLARPWTLHVEKFRKDGSPPSAAHKKIVSICRDNAW